MKRRRLLLIQLIVVLTISANAQTTNKGQKANNTVNSVGVTASTTNATLGTVKNTMGTVKSFFGDKKPTNQTIIAIAGIEYSDANFATLKEEVRKIKGVKNLTTAYKDGIASLTFTFKGDDLLVYDGLSKSTKELFKLGEAADHNIVLEYKHAKSK